MSGFELAAGVFQVAGFGTSLGSVIWECAKDIRDAKKDLESIATEVEATSTVLRQVGTLLSHPDTKALHTDQLMEDTGKVLQGCKSVFTDLDSPVRTLLKKLREGRTGQRTLAKLQWPFEKTNLTELRVVLGRYRTVLHLMLTVFQIEESRQNINANGMDRVEAQLKDLLLSNKDLSDSHKSLCDTLFALVQGKSASVPRSPSPASAPISSSSPPVITGDGHQQVNVMDSQISRSAPDPQLEKQRKREQQLIVQDQLQSCQNAVRRLAISLSSAMDAWTYQTGESDHSIHSSLKNVLTEIGQLPSQLHGCSHRQPRRSTGPCGCSSNALTAFSSIFRPPGPTTGYIDDIDTLVPSDANHKGSGISKGSGSSTAVALSPNAQQAGCENVDNLSRPSGASDSLGPSSALGNGQGWMGMGAYRAHQRSPSDQLSDISSDDNSPYMQTMDSFDHTSLPNPSLSETLGLGYFTLSEPHHAESYCSPDRSPHISPRLMPQQNESPAFTADNNSGMEPAMSGQFVQSGRGAERFPSYGQHAFSSYDQPTSPSELGAADQMSPPEISTDYAPPAKESALNPRPSRALGDGDILSPPIRNHSRNRMRAKSDPQVDSRPSLPSSPSRRRSSSLQRPTSSFSLSPFDKNSTSSWSSSPATGRNGSQSSRNGRSSSVSDQRDYILDLANPERTPLNGVESRRQQKHPATFQCTLCPKRFTRAYNLRSHLRTHTDERPFVCTVCGKAFARQHDRKRHEGLHSGEKKFLCRGTLQSGSSWGCGRRFARVDALGRHFRSEAGRVCIHPVLDEEAAESQIAWLEEQQQAQIAAGLVAPSPTIAQLHMDMTNNFLPAALLQQYPALAGLDWNSIPLGPPPDEEAYGGRSSLDASSDSEPHHGDLSENEIGSYPPNSTFGGMGTGYGKHQQSQPVTLIAHELASRWLKGFAKPELSQNLHDMLSGMTAGQGQGFGMHQQQLAGAGSYMNGFEGR